MWKARADKMIYIIGIIYRNETKFEIYCNDKTERQDITEILLKVVLITITSKNQTDGRHKVGFSLIRVKLVLL